MIGVFADVKHNKITHCETAHTVAVTLATANFKNTVDKYK